MAQLGLVKNQNRGKSSTKKNLCIEKSFESKIQEEKTGSHERSSYPLEQLTLRESSLPKHGVAKTGSSARIARGSTFSSNFRVFSLLSSH